MLDDDKPFSLEYRIAGPTIQAFHQCGFFVRGIMGPIGSGKSTACAWELFFRAMRQRPNSRGIRKTRWAVIRNTMPQLKSTTIPTFQEWFPTRLGKWRADGPAEQIISLTLPDKTTVEMVVWFIALDRPDDVKKLLSLELTGAWVNEAREVPKAIIDGLTGRVGRYPSRRDNGGPSWSGIIMDTNPPDTDHWWYRLAEEETPKGWSFFRQPSGVSEEAENIHNLPGGVGYYTRTMAGKTEDWINVYVRGEYGMVADGKPVYPEFGHAHVSPDPIRPVKGADIIIGVDFGLTPAAIFCQRLVTGSWLILRELVMENAGATTLGGQIARIMADEFPGYRARIWGDPAGMQRSQADEATAIAAVGAASGFPAMPAPGNGFVLRREAVAAALKRFIDGKPGFLIDKKCTTLVKGFFGNYRYKRMQISGDERYHDVPDKNRYSHPHDALQYAMLGGGEGSISKIVNSNAFSGAMQPAITDFSVLG